ncbi:MAG: ATP-binding protein [Desulfovibrionaceae bacterium]|nr:ATP-binding protein [Desulfovibrionaceae bacterium]
MRTLSALPLRSKINLAILLTFTVVALISGFFLSYYAAGKRQDALDHVQVLLQSVVAQRYESLANEIFARQDRAVAVTLDEMIKVRDVVGAAVFLPNGAVFGLAGHETGEPLPQQERSMLDGGARFFETVLGGQRVLCYAEAISMIGEDVGYLRITYSPEHLDRQGRTMAMIFLSALGVNLVVMLGLLHWLLRRAVLGPVDQLRGAMERVRGGRPGETVALDTGDEIGGMARSFNAMSLALKENAASIEASQRQIEEANRTLEAKVRQRTADLESANASLTGEIQERERARAESARLLDLLTATIESTAEGILVVDTNRDIVAINHRFLELFGLSRDWSLLPTAEARLAATAARTKDPAAFAARVCELLDTLTMEAVDVVEMADGRLLERRARTYRMAGRVCGRLYTYQDVTERTLAEKQLRDAVSELEAIVENTLVGIALIQDGLCRKINRRGAEILGYLPEELTGKPLSHLYTTVAGGATFEARYQEALIRDGAFRNDEDVRRKDGGIGWVRIYAKSLDPLRPMHEVIFAFDDISLEKQLEENLRAAKDAAEAGTRAKSSFLAAMSHEIRTPLNAVAGMTEAALATTLTPEQRDYLGVIKDSATHLLAVLNDILDISKIEAGRLTLEHIDFDLRRVLEGVRKALAPQAQAKGLSLTLTVAPDVPGYLRGDPLRLRQVLFNLAGNAVKFTPQGEVRIDVGRLEAPDADQGVKLSFSVSDTGIGIPEDRLDGIFQTFTQATTAITRSYGGTGLGLSISRQIVELMGGTIAVRSTLGRGSRFRFEIHFQTGNPDLAQDAGDALPALPETRPLRLLLVEDNALNARVATLMLSRLGHAGRHVPDVEKALATLAREDFDAVLMDIEMPDIDGLEATRRIRRGGHGLFPVRQPGVPILAMTAHALPEIRQECIKAGMDGFLTKPVSQTELARALHRVAGPGDAPATPRPARDGQPDDAAGTDPEACADPPVLDKDYAIRRMGIGDAEYRLILAVGAKETVSGLATAKTALEEGNLEGLARTAHTLKSATGTMGALSCREAAARLEEAARANDAARAGDALGELEQEAAKVMAAWQEMTGPRDAAPCSTEGDP